MTSAGGCRRGRCECGGERCYRGESHSGGELSETSGHGSSGHDGPSLAEVVWPRSVRCGYYVKRRERESTGISSFFPEMCRWCPRGLGVDVRRRHSYRFRQCRQIGGVDANPRESPLPDTKRGSRPPIPSESCSSGGCRVVGSPRVAGLYMKPLRQSVSWVTKITMLPDLGPSDVPQAAAANRPADVRERPRQRSGRHRQSAG